MALKQVKHKQDLDVLSIRDETLRKDLNTVRMGLGRTRRELNDKEPTNYDLTDKLEEDTRQQVINLQN